MSDKHKDARGELRADFEAWCLAERNDLSSVIDEAGNKHYCSTFTGTAWRVWQAALARRASQVSAAAPAGTALRKLCDQLDGMKRRLLHTPGTGQHNSYLFHEDVACYVEEARKYLASEGQAQTSAAVELWRARYLCEAILNDCVVEATKHDARAVRDAIDAAQLADRTALGEDGQSDSFKLAEVLRGLGIGSDVAGNSAASLYIIARAIQGQAKSVGSTEPGAPVARETFASWTRARQDAFRAENTGLAGLIKEARSAAPTAQQSLTDESESMRRATALDFVRAVWSESGYKVANRSERIAMEQALDILASTQSLTAGGAVPRIPTEAMLSASHDWAMARFGEGVGSYGATDIWQVMYDAAAPLPQIQSEPDDSEVVCDECGLLRGESRLLSAIGDAKREEQRAADQQPVTPSGALADNDGGVA